MKSLKESKMPSCPRCHGRQVVKNGVTYLGKQNFKCRKCGRQFVENPQQKLISAEMWKQVDKLLLEKISLAGIARVVGISETWLQKYVNKLYQKQKIEQVIKKKPR